MRPPPRLLIAALGVLGLVAVSCGDDDDVASSASVRGSITVFAAASLTDAFEEIGTAFTAANPDADVTFSFAGSSDLVAQINEGAPADVFAAADQANMEGLTEAAGHAGEPEVFATNRLAIITGPGNPHGITGVDDLADPDLIVVTCATEVPCGRYAQEVFDAAGATVTPKSFEESVRGVANKVTLGEADAGIVYATDVLAAGDEAAGVEIPDDINVVARYPIVTTADAANPATAQAFVAFVLGPAGRQILAGHCFTGP
jgi:molybdate transport system substrate-binding protein